MTNSLDPRLDSNSYRMLRLLISVRSRAAMTLVVLCSTLAPLVVVASNADWPQFLGPERNGNYTGPPFARVWGKDGPPVRWKRDVGAGFAGVAVSGSRLILLHRLGDRAVVECLEASTGKQTWKADHTTDYRDDFGFDDGPRATPAVADGRVFTFGAEGRLSCWKLETGEPVWNVDTAKTFGTGKGYFGRACSPLVESNLVVMNLGGRDGAGIVAFEAGSGKVRWQVTKDEASYSAPVVATIQGRRLFLVLTREALVALQPADGRLIFRHPWRPAMSASVSAAVPLVVEDQIFLSASYGAGASLFRFKETGPETIWADDDTLSNHYATSVYHQGFLYGWHGRQEQGCELRCVELKSGKVRWRESGLKAGTVTLAGDELLVLTERGELIRSRATPEGFKPIARAQVLPSEVRAAPALANGLMFARSRKQLVCLDLAKAQ